MDRAPVTALLAAAGAWITRRINTPEPIANGRKRADSPCRLRSKEFVTVFAFGFLSNKCVKHILAAPARTVRP